MWINQTEKTFIVVFVFGTVVFLYYFFIVPPTPVYYEYDHQNWKPIPRDAIRTDDGRYIIGYERPSAIFVAPVAVMFYLFMIMLTDGGRVRLREIISIRDGISGFKDTAKKKFLEGIQEYRDWKKK